MLAQWLPQRHAYNGRRRRVASRREGVVGLRNAYSACVMGGTRTRMRVGLSLAAVTLVLAMLGFTGSAGAHTSCAQIGTVYGIPPWGFHTGAYSGESWFAKAHGNT